MMTSSILSELGKSRLALEGESHHTRGDTHDG